MKMTQSEIYVSLLDVKTENISLNLTLPDNDDEQLTERWHDAYGMEGQQEVYVDWVKPKEYDGFMELTATCSYHLNLAAHFMVRLDDLALEDLMQRSASEGWDAERLCIKARDAYIDIRQAELVRAEIDRRFPFPTDEQAAILEHVDHRVLGSKLMEQEWLAGNKIEPTPVSLGWDEAKMWLGELRVCHNDYYFPITGSPTANLSHNGVIETNHLEPFCAEALADELEQNDLTDLQDYLYADTSHTWDSVLGKLRNITLGVRVLDGTLAGKISITTTSPLRSDEWHSLEDAITATLYTGSYSEALQDTVFTLPMEAEHRLITPCECRLDFAPAYPFHLLEVEDFRAAQARVIESGMQQ